MLIYLTPILFYKVGTIINPTLQIGKLEPREIMKLSQDT